MEPKWKSVGFVFYTQGYESDIQIIVKNASFLKASEVGRHQFDISKVMESKFKGWVPLYFEGSKVGELALELEFEPL